jgi:GNAT superfamily N-acetyltransferase
VLGDASARRPAPGTGTKRWNRLHFSPGAGDIDGHRQGYSPAVGRSVVVELVAVETTRPLRREILRPGAPTADVVYRGDDDARAAHGAAVDRSAGEAVLAVGSVLPEAPPWAASRSDGWRVRGMATRPSVRGQGLGRLVLDVLVGHVADHGGGLVWCHARTGALSFYRRAGFTTRGAVFDLPPIGPHRTMWRMVAPDVATAAADGEVGSDA